MYWFGGSNLPQKSGKLTLARTMFMKYHSFISTREEGLPQVCCPKMGDAVVLAEKYVETASELAS